MIVVRSLEEISKTPGPRAVALGFFDGVHVGHRKIIRELVAESRAAGLVSTCLTFDPHPRLVLQSAPECPKMLTSLEEKIALFGSLGVEVSVVVRFDREFSGLTPAEFASSVLKEALDARVVSAGFNFTFGRGGAGKSDDLIRLGAQLGFDVRIHRPVMIDGEPVSSTAIREAVSRGNMAMARKMLGRPYSLEGEVIAGDGRGRLLDMPTANLSFAPERLLPSHGVYATLSTTARGKFPSVTNVGMRPTYPATRTTVETYIPGFAGDIYGTRMRVMFLRKLRDERRFRDGADLSRQVRSDAEVARKIALEEMI